MLVLGLMGRTLQVLGAWPAARRTHLVTGDHHAAQAARRLHSGITVVREPPNGASAVLMLPADLMLSSTTVIEPQFGQDSLEAHVRAAAAVDASLQVVRDPAFDFDLDMPEDLERLDADLVLEIERIGQELLDLPDEGSAAKPAAAAPGATASPSARGEAG